MSDRVTLRMLDFPVDRRLGKLSKIGKFRGKSDRIVTRQCSEPRAEIAKGGLFAGCEVPAQALLV